MTVSLIQEQIRRLYIRNAAWKLQHIDLWRFVSKVVTVTDNTSTLLAMPPSRSGFRDVLVFHLVLSLLILAMFASDFVMLTLRHCPATAFPGEFLAWAADRLGMALANFCLIVSLVCLALLAHDYIACFRCLCSLCANRFIGSTTVPSPVQLETDEPNTEEEGSLPRIRPDIFIVHRTLLLLMRFLSLLVLCGILV